MDASEIEEHLEGLRRIYIESTPRQRHSIAIQRIHNPEHGPNLLIAHVCAVEGFARSLAMHEIEQTKPKLSKLYPRYRNRKAEELIEEYLTAKALPSPATYFGADYWQLFKFAVAYRHLLVHECTYLGQDRSPQLIQACTVVFNGLAKVAGLNLDEL